MYVTIVSRRSVNIPKRASSYRGHETIFSPPRTEPVSRECVTRGITGSPNFFLFVSFRSVFFDFGLFSRRPSAVTTTRSVVFGFRDFRYEFCRTGSVEGAARVDFSNSTTYFERPINGPRHVTRRDVVTPSPIRDAFYRTSVRPVH